MNEVAAVAFDLDGVLIESEQTWDEARRAVVIDAGGHWGAGATRDMMGMSAPEWSRYMHDTLGVPLSDADIDERVVQRVLDAYARDLPVLAGATTAVARLGARWPLALASSSNRVVIEAALRGLHLDHAFRVVVSSEEVPHGKPAPDVYLAAAQQLGVPADQMVAVEDSANGIRSAVSAGMRVVAIPNTEFPPPASVLSMASVVLASLDELTATVVVSAESPSGEPAVSDTRRDRSDAR